MAPPNPAAAPAAPAGAQPPQAVTRQIIYSATIEVVVKNLTATRQSVERVTEEQKGYIAKSEVIGDAGSRRSATWTLKVPADQFRAAVNALAALGDTVRNSSDSQDVTEEFTDLQARVRNLKSEEETLNKLLKDRAVRLEDVLKIREQIARVRGDIERAEGRVKYLATMAAMSTITLAAREDASYVPPTAPTFASRASGTFHTSVAALRDFGQWLALLAVALAPWLPLILVGALLLRWTLRRLVALSESSRQQRTPRLARPVAEPSPPA